MNVVALRNFPVKVILSSPAEISYCNDVVLDATSSTGSSGRPFVVTWFVSFSATRAIEIQRILNSFNGSLQARIPSCLLLPGERYLFGVRLSNFFGIADSSTISVAILKTTIPSVYIQRSPEFRVNVFEDNYVTASVELPACQGDPIEFNIKWTVSEISSIH